ncbi:MAG: VWA domain-containing protein, partial [Rhodospirillales bacterium]|nr:VWA domain-containing protein [Rhodospirillales bacterium]
TQVAWVLDRSGSTTPYWDEITGSTNSGIEKLKAGKRIDTTVVWFDSTAEIALPIGNVHDAAPIGRPTESGGTEIGKGLELAADELRRGSASQEFPTKNVAIVMTDGQSGKSPCPIEVSNRIHTEFPGIVVLAIGVGSADQSTLQGIATSPAHVYPMANFNELEELFSVIGHTVSGTTMAGGGTLEESLRNDAVRAQFSE